MPVRFMLTSQEISFTIISYSCRFFLEPKGHCAGVGKKAAEITWMKSCTMLDRALCAHVARYPEAGKHFNRMRKRPIGQHSDPNTRVSKRPCLVGVGPGVHYTQRVAHRVQRGTSTREHVPVEDVILDPQSSWQGIQDRVRTVGGRKCARRWQGTAVQS
jgi:hypothetical protein